MPHLPDPLEGHDCYPPPGGGGIVVPPNLGHIVGWPKWAGPCYLPWEADAALAFHVTALRGDRVDGWIVRLNQRFKRVNALVAQTTVDVEDYLEHRSLYLEKLAFAIDYAKHEYTEATAEPWPVFVEGGCVIKLPGPPMEQGSIARFEPFSYPNARAVVITLNPDPAVRLFHCLFGTGNGERTLRGVTVLQEHTAEHQNYLRQQSIWVPIYDEALRKAKEAVPYDPH